MSGEGKTFIASNFSCQPGIIRQEGHHRGTGHPQAGIEQGLPHTPQGKGNHRFPLRSPKYRFAFHDTAFRSIGQSSCTAGGAIPPNPTELLARKSLDDAIELLKKDYDYVVLDTAPIGMVTDTAAHSARCRHQRLRMPCRAVRESERLPARSTSCTPTSVCPVCALLSTAWT